ncbi:MAG TPA: winged helix-turn-helix transcriptional regulator [Clostridiales bacterium]|nr:winged helix-turn-helix transcriptional regulator [Clostridiales bacterium]
MPKQITLTTRKQLDIYMNPQRQRLLKAMDIHAAPMTPKQLSSHLGISASSVSHHLKKLEELDLVGLDHTESIRGIQAKYYKRLPVVINLGSDKDDDLKEERTLLSDYCMNETWKSFKEHMEQLNDRTNPLETGDVMNGILYLTQEEAEQLKALILGFYSRHMEPAPGTVPWETAIIAFPHKAYPAEKTIPKNAED